MKLLVIGGAGYYGRRVVEALRPLDGVEVAIGGRRGPVVVDLADPQSHGPLDDFDVVVDVADTVNAAPEAAARRVVARGGIWLEVSADAAVTARLLALDVSGPGTLVVGVGIFPGISTALAARAAAGMTAPAIELGVRLSPFSGAGRGNCALMRRMLETPGVRIVDGRAIETPAVFAAAPMPFPSGERSAAGIGLPDALLIHRATRATAVTTRMALVPGLLRFSFALGAGVMRFAGPLRRPLGWLAEWSLVGLRAVLLRGVSSRVELVAVAREGAGEPRIEQLDVADGQQGTAAGVAAAVACLLDGSRPAAGVLTAPEAFGADVLLAAFAPG